MDKPDNQEISPVFIVGEARSGSSILNRTLEIHSSFRPKKVWHIESKIMSFSTCAHKLVYYKNSGPFKYMLLNEELFQSFLSSIKTIRSIHANLHRCHLGTLCNSNPVLWSAVGRNHIMLRLFFLHAQEARCCKRILEKTPSNAIHAWKLQMAFPKCKILYLCRHPLDVYSSYKKLTERLGPHSWSDISPEQFCLLYEKRVEKLLQFKSRNASNCMLIRYEHFCRSPQNTLADICRFIREPLELACLDPALSDRKQEGNNLITESITAQTKKWESYLDRTMAKRIEDRLAMTMQRLQYKRYT